MTSTGLQGRGVIVTGAGSGIGQATAVKFAKEGASVLVADVNQEGAEQTVKTIEEAGGTAKAVIGDLRDQKVIDEIVDTAVQAFGALNVLVNNAGIMDHMSALGETEDDEWDSVIGVNLTAPFRLTRAALPHLLAAGNAAIVFTASEAALRGSAAGAAYTASKHGIVGLTKSLAVMYRKNGIRTNAIAPGGTATNLRPAVHPDAHGPAVLGPHLGLGVGDKLATAEEQAAAIAFLASDAASYINGAVLPVDNGWSAT
ncbi:SDR family NAD(P)-dependent oxidoreductase [Streptomyces sp. NBC_00286]|uniref:SDR family NAD(P)-dependent oxidoreductase n=1 Tax=Streptomyces sp. NBC_00286 TaxID=2975701 RepID=UPI002E2CBA0A|nr:SDR family NAD(P)-dependent oxidoreductase [Streptomyces sp. NBC_00286]